MSRERQDLFSRGALGVFRLNGQFLAVAEELARPAGLYLPFVFALLLAAVGLWRRRVVLHAGLAVALLVPALVPVGAWMARNRAVFGIGRLTHADAVMLVYFTGAGALQVQEGISLEQAQSKISAEFRLPPPEVTTMLSLSAFSSSPRT